MMFNTIKDRLANLHKSMTVWFNSLMLAFLLYLPDLKESLPDLQPYVTPEVYKWMGLVMVIGNILLRIKTTKALEQK